MYRSSDAISRQYDTITRQPRANKPLIIMSQINLWLQATTDHQSLIYFCDQPALVGRKGSWVDLMQDFVGVAWVL